MQVFESWAHHLSEDQFTQFAKVSHSIYVYCALIEVPHSCFFCIRCQPYAARIAAYIRAKHEDAVPVVYFANGGSCFLHQQLDMGMHALSVDWRISMKHARSIVGESTVLAGNVDPMVLYGSERDIQAAVQRCITEAGTGQGHVLNLGHGVEQDIPESAVQCFVQAARAYSSSSGTSNSK